MWKFGLNVARNQKIILPSGNKIIINAVVILQRYSSVGCASRYNDKCLYQLVVQTAVVQK